jgi:ArsR family transcriptional regulator
MPAKPRGPRSDPPATPTSADDVPISELKAELFRALGNPGRIRILEQLVQGERSVGELQPLVGLESSHLSQQLGVLRRANLVVARKEGNQVFYSVRSALMADVLAAARQLLISSLSDTQSLLADLSEERSG